MSLSHSPLIVRDGLVLCLDAANPRSYPKSGTTWSDLAGANDGTLTNGPTFDADDKGSIVFDGSNDYINLGDVLDAKSGDYTFGSWSRLTSLNSSNRMIMDKRSGTDRILLYSTHTTGYIIAAIGDGSQIFLASDNIDHRGGTWRNYIFTVNRTSNLLILYRNGVLVASADISGLGDQNNSINFLIGAGYLSGSSPNGAYHWQGNISNTLIYNRALTASEVLQNYNATRGRYGI